MGCIAIFGLVILALTSWCDAFVPISKPTPKPQTPQEEVFSEETNPGGIRRQEELSPSNKGLPAKALATGKGFSLDPAMENLDLAPFKEFIASKEVAETISEAIQNEAYAKEILSREWTQPYQERIKLWDKAFEKYLKDLLSREGTQPHDKSPNLSDKSFESRACHQLIFRIHKASTV